MHTEWVWSERNGFYYQIVHTTSADFDFDIFDPIATAKIYFRYWRNEEGFTMKDVRLLELDEIVSAAVYAGASREEIIAHVQDQIAFAEEEKAKEKSK